MTAVTATPLVVGSVVWSEILALVNKLIKFAENPFQSAFIKLKRCLKGIVYGTNWVGTNTDRAVLSMRDTIFLVVTFSY